MLSEVGRLDPLLPDMRLYSLIIFLKHFAVGKWVVENVVPYYEPLIRPTVKLGRHLFWSNFRIPSKEFKDSDTAIRDVTSKTTRYGYCLENVSLGQRKDQVLRNMVNPDIGKYVLDCALLHENKTLTQYGSKS
jgi:DNA (cytosine-5)-methyltransferase 1